MKFWDTGVWLAAIKREENFKITLMKFRDTRFWLAARKRAEIEKYLDEISRHSVLIGSEETCGELKNTFMKFWDTHFWLAAKKCAEKLKNT